MMQHEITQPGPLLDKNGRLVNVGWSRQPLLDCNLEQARFYPLGLFQRFRKKRWDYYAVFTPRRFFSATIADLGYAANIFVYTLDFATGDLHEEGLVVPLGRGVQLERNSPEGEAVYAGGKALLRFQAGQGERRISVDWPSFHGGRGIQADISLAVPPGQESMTIVIPIGDRRFYYNTKINCLPATGRIRYGDDLEELQPETSLGQLDWGRGVWEYSSYWNWASASGFLPDGRTIGLNLGRGFGDLSRATENAIILDGRVHKLGDVAFGYTGDDYMRSWRFTDDAGRLDLTFTPFKDRIARTNLGIIFSEVHQMFGRYNGRAVLDGGTALEIRDLIGFAEEHRARW
ncbi:MAG: DUF2804 domain-containing protein [Candidatus Promineofilum sp.]|nr:DUF2804 domain-containing protein [Promineifilum sp.]